MTVTGRYFFLGRRRPLFGHLGGGGFQESGSGTSFGSGEKYRSMLILPLSPRIHNFGSVLATLAEVSAIANFTSAVSNYAFF